MYNPFFKNHGPLLISEILNILKIANNRIDPNHEVKDIKDLVNSKKDEITFFHSKK